MTPGEYRGFIREAYVAPLRSVLIVDDDYPTLEEALAPVPEAERERLQDVGRGKRWWSEPDRIQEVITGFRRSKPPMIVDIHDGENLTQHADAQVALHLHQSDLLILDYSLDKSNKGNGERAIQIMRKVLLNEQFNLVVLHTSEILDDIFPDIVLALHAPADRFISEDEEMEVIQHIAPAENKDDTLMRRIERSFTLAHYLFFRQHKCVWPEAPGPDAPPMALFDTLAEEAGFADDRLKRLLAKLALRKLETTLRPKMLASPLQNLAWFSGPRKWIRADTGFIAFSSKPDNADLIDELVLALECSKPDPSKLFLAKMRSEIDKEGVTESKTLGNAHVLAHWYKRLLDSSDEARKFQISESMARHAELLMADIQKPVADFAGRMIKADAKGSHDAVCKTHFDVDLGVATDRERAVLEHNTFVCSKEQEGHHLATGHVFEADGSLWVCMTPLCDLVPGRLKLDRHGKIGERLPFLAVRLELVTLPAKKVKVTSNRFVFLRIDGIIKTYCIAKESDDGSNPIWFSLFAENQGRFGRAFTFKFTRAQLDRKGVFVMKVLPAKVVAQLRYEYALNFMQKLGTSMTRIGLDFV
ncbi:response regulator receiver domain [Brevundimonas sp.]|uniref:response regulator receiver domain n=1 Tax=Brevundimonas sp. TaxID=1871086 RepID=UPI0028AAD53A|nr:response regulator receiver domain [Brevundimonas sp.]